MEIRVEFTIDYKDGCDWKKKKAVSHFLHQLREYKTGERWGMNFTYVLSQNETLYQELVEFYKNNQEDIEFLHSLSSVKLTDEDYEKAVAFIPLEPAYYCEEYEDIEYEYNQCKSCECKRKSNVAVYIQPKGYIKRHEFDYGMAGIDAVGGSLVLLPKLVQKLTEEGIDKKFFEAVHSKSQKIVGYIYSTENILPEGAVKDANFKLESRCPFCGGINLKEKEDEYYIKPKYIQKDVLKCLQDVNYTAEFFEGYREVVVSKKVAKIISECVKYAEFMPIFLER